MGQIQLLDDQTYAHMFKYILTFYIQVHAQERRKIYKNNKSKEL